jgi:hypothetical protein
VVLIAVLFVADLGEISTGYGNRPYKGNTLLCTF